MGCCRKLLSISHGSRQQHGFVLVLACVSNVLLIVYSLVLPFIYRFLFDDVLPNRSWGEIGVAAGMLLGIFLLAVLSSFIVSYSSSKLGVKFISALKFKLLKYNVENRSDHDALMIKFTTDLTMIEYVLIHVFWGTIRSVIIIVAAIALLLLLDWRLSLISLGLIGVLFVLPKVISKKSVSIDAKRKHGDNRLIEFFSEAGRLRYILAAYSAYRFAYDRFKKWLSISEKRSYKYNFLIDLVERTSFLGSELLVIVVIFCGILFVMMGYSTLGTLVAFVTLLIRVTYAFAGLAVFYPSFTQGLNGLLRIKPYLKESEKEQIVESGSSIKLSKVELEHLELTFQKNHVLKDINISIHPDKLTAIIGKNGSGKSCILKLMSSLLKPSSGAIHFYNREGQILKSNELSGKIAIVFQDDEMFECSIYENITLGLESITLDDVIAVTKKIGLHDYIDSLERKYDTIIDDAAESGSVQFSGGQKRRLSLARAIVHQSELVLLDEPFNGLDPASLSIILSVIEELKKDRCVVITTHIFPDDMHCDEIYMLSEGVITGHGTHDELIINNEAYQDYLRRNRA